MPDPAEKKTSAMTESSTVTEPDGETVTFRISGLAYLTLGATAIVIVILMGASFVWFSWTIVLLFLQAWWIHRLRTVVGPDGIRAVSTFRTTDLPWDDVKGLAFPKMKSVRAVRADGTTVRLPAVGFRDTPALHVASGGRIPDPYAAARDAELAAGD
ncbi:MAG: PH domain-containing protein [Gordonia sp. (in: high G+C Gram-positive bacteria)]